MKRILLVCLISAAAILAETPGGSVPVRDTSSIREVSLSSAEKCPSDSILSANYAKYAQALTIAVESRMDKNAGRNRSMEMASTAGAFVGGALLGFLLGWLVL